MYIFITMTLQNTCTIYNIKQKLKQHNSTHSCAGPTSKVCVWANPSVHSTSPTPSVTWQGNVTYTSKYSTESSTTGAVAGAVVAIVGLLLLTGTAVVVVIALVLR